MLLGVLRYAGRAIIENNESWHDKVGAQVEINTTRITRIEEQIKALQSGQDEIKKSVSEINAEFKMLNAWLRSKP